MSPKAEDTFWVFGQEYAQISNDSVQVAVAFDRAYGDYIAFDVEITNLSQKTLHVSPEKFYYLPQHSLGDSVTYTPVNAINPESKLLEIDKKLSKGEANYASEVAVAATLSLLDVFLEIATDEEVATNAELERDISRVEREQNHARRVQI